jgi:hypothetical protein
MRYSTARRLTEAGFGLGIEVTATGLHASCGHQFGPHVFAAASGSPFDGGLFFCQYYPECPCSGTWGTTAPDDVEGKYRGQYAAEAHDEPQR